MKLLLLTLAALFLSACSLLVPTCRYASGPASITVTADMTGGQAMAQLEDGGQFLSYPPDDTGTCVAPPVRHVAPTP